MKHFSLFTLLALVAFTRCAKDFTDGQVTETDAFPIVHASTRSIDGGETEHFDNQYDFLKRSKHFTSEYSDVTYRFEGNKVYRNFRIFEHHTWDTINTEYTLINGFVSEYTQINTSDDITRRVVYERNPDMTTHKTITYLNGEENSTAFYEYDNEGLKTKITYYYSNGNLAFTANYTYNKELINTIDPRNFGQRFQEPWQKYPVAVVSQINGSGAEYRRDEYAYTTDANGNIATRLWTYPTSSGAITTYYSEYFYEE